MIETPSVNSSCAPSESSGTSTTSSAELPSSAPIATSTRISGTGSALAISRATKAALSSRLSVRKMSSVIRAGARGSLALERHARHVAGRDQQQDDHDAGTECHRDQSLPGVVASGVEGLLGGGRPLRLVAREPLGGLRHRAEPRDLGAEEDVAHALVAPLLQRPVGDAVE